MAIIVLLLCTNKKETIVFFFETISFSFSRIWKALKLQNLQEWRFHLPMVHSTCERSPPQVFRSRR
jgi:hypothetical protein